MQDQGLKPNSVILVVSFLACSHDGLVDEGLEIFETMSEKFDIMPHVEHYAFVVGYVREGRKTGRS